VLVTIIPSPGALGRTFFQGDDRGVLFRRDLLAMAAAALGGRAAEEEVYGEASAGAIGDLAAAERIVRSAIRSGLSEAASDQAIREFALSGITSDGSASAARNDVAELLGEAWHVAREAVRTHRAQLDALTDALMHHRSVQGDALLALLPPAPPTVALRRRPASGGAA
jgi:cell division protease FtsH